MLLETFLGQSDRSKESDSVEEVEKESEGLTPVVSCQEQDEVGDDEEEEDENSWKDFDTLVNHFDGMDPSQRKLETGTVAGLDSGDLNNVIVIPY